MRVHMDAWTCMPHIVHVSELEMCGSTASCVLTASASAQVCPTSILSQWVSEVKKHVKPSHLSVVPFYGPDRSVRQCLAPQVSC
jgi:hypothetical protein